MWQSILMESYTFRILQKDDVKEFKFTAEVHESLPAAWINNYMINYEEVEKMIEELIKKHEGSQILCCVVENDNEIIGFIWVEVNEGNSEVVDIISLWTINEQEEFISDRFNSEYGEKFKTNRDELFSRFVMIQEEAV